MDKMLNMFLGGESKYQEIKERYSKTLLKTVSAFANYHDGKIIIGISEKGNIIGVHNSESVRLTIENAINDNIKPRPYYEVQTYIIENVDILVFTIFKGDNTPYTHDRKAYQRLDTSTVEIDKASYDELVLLGRNLTFEELDYKGVDLKFKKLENLLQENMDISELDLNIIKSLELYKNGFYNNAAVLISDKNIFKEIGLDLIRYKDNTMLEIKDRIQIKGASVIEHFEKSMEFYHKHINKSDIINGEKRITFEEVPLVAYREAIANAIVHRNYSKRGNNRIEVFEDRIEIVSIGGLPIGISKIEFMNGSFSNVRNRIITDIFYRVNIIEKLGTGIRRIKNVYAKHDENPRFEAMENSVKIILPKIRSLARKNKSGVKNDILRKLTPEEEKLFDYIKSSNEVNRAIIEKYMDIRKTKATKMINRLMEIKLIAKNGRGKNVKYRIL